MANRISSSRPLALLCGDPSGIGPEIIARWLAAPENRQNVVPVGPQSWLDTLPVPGIAVGNQDYRISPGQPDEAGQRLALAAMEAGAAGCRDGTFAGAVTGPVNKARLAAVGYPFPGQTEFFADRWGGEPVMAFAGGKLRVALATWHIPLQQVSARLSCAVLRRTVAAAVQLASAARAKVPARIGICGLNPHAGENGLLGAEEMERINPWLADIRREFPGVSDCQPGDTLFWRHLQGEFDAVVALYHDQGLAPLKTLEFDQSVNLTLSLPFIRTSPDHGTAYALAGKNTASLTSWDNAVRLAHLLSDAR